MILPFDGGGHGMRDVLVDDQYETEGIDLSTSEVRLEELEPQLPDVWRQVREAVEIQDSRRGPSVGDHGHAIVHVEAGRPARLDTVPDRWLGALVDRYLAHEPGQAVAREFRVPSKRSSMLFLLRRDGDRWERVEHLWGEDVTDVTVARLLRRAFWLDLAGLEPTSVLAEP